MLQAAAIHQLATFILGRAEAFNPTELTGEKNPFAQPGIAIIRALLDERSWETRWAKHMETRTQEQVSGQADDNKEAELHRSPVVLAIEDLFRQHDFPTRDFINWNLSGLILGNVWWYLARLDFAHLEGADLRGAHLEGANLFDAHLEKASLFGAHLEKASLLFAHLEGAHLVAAHLEGADLSVAHLEGAILFGAHLEEVTFNGAYLEGARIDRRWETAIDWGAMQIYGTPIFVDPGEDEEK